MSDKPDIVKRLREEEKLGRLHGQSQGAHEELEIPKDLLEDMSDENVEGFKENVENREFNIEPMQHGSLSGGESVDEKELLFHGSSDIMLYFDTFGRVIKANKTAVILSGYLEEEFIGKPFWKMSGPFTKQNLKTYFRTFKNTLRGKATEHFVCELNEKSGKEHIIDFSSYPIKENGKVTRILLIGKDVTEQKETENRYRLITENTDDLVAVATFSLNPKYTYISPSHEKMMGYLPEDMIGKSGFDFIHSENRKDLLHLLKKYIGAKGKKNFTGKDLDVSADIEYRAKDKSEEWHYLKSTINVVGNELIFVSKDVTDRKKAEEELRLEKDRLQALMGGLNQTEIGVDIVDMDYKILSQNQFLKERFGDCTGKLCYKEYMKQENPCDFCIMEKAIKSGKVEKVKLTAADGRDYELLSAPLLNLDGTVDSVIEVVRDITKRKQAEDALRESEEKYRLLADNTIDCIWKLNKDLRFTYVNPAIFSLLGFSSEEWVGSMLDEHCSPEEMKKVSDIIAEELEKKVTYTRTFEMYLDHKDGRKVCTEIKGKIIFDENKNPVEFQGVTRDITGHKRAEEELKESHEILKAINTTLELKVNERTAEVSKLLEQKDEIIRMIGHDLKNPLGPLFILLPMVEGKVEDPKLKEMLQVSIRNVKSLKEMLFKTLEFAKQSELGMKVDFSNICLNENVSNLIESRQVLFTKINIAVENKIDEKIMVNADKLLLDEVFDNLFTNAVKYSQENGGMVTVDALEENDFVKVSVKDTGIGLTEEQLGRIFDKFYKNDDVRHIMDSHGLGLSICKRIVEKHGGAIWAESEGEGKGTTMFFTIPISSEKQEDK